MEQKLQPLSILNLNRVLADVPFSGGFVVARGDVEIFGGAHAAAGNVDAYSPHVFPCDVDVREQPAQACPFGCDDQSADVAADEAVERDQQYHARGQVHPQRTSQENEKHLQAADGQHDHQVYVERGGEVGPGAARA